MSTATCFILCCHTIKIPCSSRVNGYVNSSQCQRMQETKSQLTGMKNTFPTSLSLSPSLSTSLSLCLSVSRSLSPCVPLSLSLSFSLFVPLYLSSLLPTLLARQFCTAHSPQRIALLMMKQLKLQLQNGNEAQSRRPGSYQQMARPAYLHPQHSEPKT